jgi:hypothetical protein
MLEKIRGQTVPSCAGTETTKSEHSSHRRCSVEDEYNAFVRATRDRIRESVQLSSQLSNVVVFVDVFFKHPPT